MLCPLLVLLSAAATAAFAPLSAPFALHQSHHDITLFRLRAPLVSLRTGLHNSRFPNIVANVDVAAAGHEIRHGQATNVNILISNLGLQQEDAPSTLSLGGNLQGTVQSWTGGDVSWCSTLDIVGDNFAQNMFTVWNGPLVGVPHFRYSVTVAPDGVSLFVDFCPRADAGYEQISPDGTFPEPDSREKFMQRSVRTENGELYFTPESQAWLARASSAEGAQVVRCPPAPLCEGPLRLDMRLPATRESVGHAGRVCAEAVGLYAGWMGGAERFGQVKSQLAFAHDCKVRAMITGAQAAALDGAFGAPGAELAAAHGGPRDIVDRGGAMSNAAKDNLTPGEAGNG